MYFLSDKLRLAQAYILSDGLEGHVGNKSHDKHNQKNYNHSPDQHSIEVMLILHGVVYRNHCAYPFKRENSTTKEERKARRIECFKFRLYFALIVLKYIVY